MPPFGPVKRNDLVKMVIAKSQSSASSPTMRVRDRGQVTLPAAIRRALNLGIGDRFSIIQIDDMLVLTRKKLVVPEPADKVARILEEDGVTLDDLLVDLEMQRHKYYEEMYGGGQRRAA